MGRTLEEIEAIVNGGLEPNFGWDDLTHDVVHDLLAIAQGQREEIKRLRKNHLFRMLQVVLYRYRAGLCKRSQTDKVDRFADRIRDALTA